MKRFLYIFIYIMVTGQMTAQNLVTHAPQHVEVGEQFQVSYILNTQDIRGFSLGSIPDGLEILYGPSTSSQSSFQMINGHTSSSSVVTVSYVMKATKKGTFQLPIANAHVGSKTMTSSPVKVTAMGTAQSSATVQQDDDDDLFILVSANKKRVHEQEPILLTYKVYTLVDLVRLDGKMPDLKGFHTQEVKLPQQKSFHQETFKGKNYRCVTWMQYVMYPQMTGKLEIPGITFHGIVQQETRDPRSFYHGGGYEEVKRDIEASAITIQVDPLPTKPADFSGGVGQFSISAQLNGKDAKAGEPLTLRVIVSGTGNLKLLKEPVVSFPDDFDKYDAKITDKTHLTSNGVEGNMVYDILAVPRKEGDYTIQPVKLTYYDTSAHAYKTIQTQAFQIHVAKGEGTQADVTTVTNTANELRPIKGGKETLLRKSERFYGTMTYWVVVGLLLAVLLSLLYMFRRTVKKSVDSVALRGKNANRVATRRLQNAKTFMEQGQKEAFTDETLRSLWGYVSDKLAIPVADLSRDNISGQLRANGIDEQTVSDFIAAIDECEFERYAPGDGSGNMAKILNMAMKAITNIEDSFKGQPASTSASTPAILLLILTVFFSSLSVPSSAITKDNADTEYKKGNYTQAIKDYEELLRNYASPELYYNLGNAYYMADNITQSVLAYERALMLSPSDEDIRFNLQIARSKTIDKINPAPDLFISNWYFSLVNLMSIDRWAWLAVGCLVLAIVFLLASLMASRSVYRRLGLAGLVTVLLVFVLANVFASQQRQMITNKVGAIVISASAPVKVSPDSGAKDAFVLHEGTRVEIQDKTLREWCHIQIADGREGWVRNNQIEEI